MKKIFLITLFVLITKMAFAQNLQIEQGNFIGFKKSTKIDTILVYMMVSEIPTEVQPKPSIFVIEGFRYTKDKQSFYLNKNKEDITDLYIFWMSGSKDWLLKNK